MTDYTQPRNITLTDGQYSKGPGKILYFDQSDNKASLGAAAKFALGVTAGDNSRDSAGVLDATNATVSF